MANTIHMRQVEVDEEVFQFIKTHSEPLVDTFNSTLRRLLKIPGKKGHGIPERGSIRFDLAGILPTLPKRMPQALRQILEVVYLVKSGNNRPSATRIVSEQHGVAPQTVIDKYTRQLNLTASEFDDLLDQTDLVELLKILNFKFPKYGKLIDEISSPHAKN